MKSKLIRKLGMVLSVVLLWFAPLQVDANEEEYIEVTDIEIADYESVLEVGSTMSLSGTVLPVDATETSISYTSSDTSIATVSSTGEVKGIGKGNVTITLSAGEFKKEVKLTVKVATNSISLNSNYLVLKSGETYQISAKVYPDQADQAVSYKSVDTSIATVSESGFVTANTTGTTIIVISNEDKSVAVSVIVNQVVKYEQLDKAEDKEVASQVVCPDVILASEQSVVDSKLLKHLYETKRTLEIVGHDYTIWINGSNIVNYNNELYTDIALKKVDGVLSFTLNQGNDLCGAITLCLDQPEGEYLYLYNDAKDKYEYVSISDTKEIVLTTAGEYRLQNTKAGIDRQFMGYIVVGGLVAVIIGVVPCILVKKRHWFW